MVPPLDYLPAFVIISTLLFTSPLPETQAGEDARIHDVQGKIERPHTLYQPNTDYHLVGATIFGWRAVAITGQINLNGYPLTVDTGNRNDTRISGIISGTGDLTWLGDSVPQVGPSILNGPRSDTFSAIFTMGKGVLDLQKHHGVIAISGNLTLGGQGPAVIRLFADERVAHTADITFLGPGPVTLDTEGHNKTLATLTLATDTLFACGLSSMVHFTASADRIWEPEKTLTITQYTKGKMHTFFGSTAAGLTWVQRNAIGFLNPTGKAPGVYGAALLSAGERIPSTQVTSVNNRFDICFKVATSRGRIYLIPGLKVLVDSKTPLKSGTKIAFLGDSITWIGGFFGRIQQKLDTSASTDPLSVQLINRGMNGGGVLGVCDGVVQSGFAGSSSHVPFAESIVKDAVDAPVIMIGINDVWWRNSKEADFEDVLLDLIRSAHRTSTRVVLTTLLAHGELPSGANRDAAKMARFCEIITAVAKTEHVVLVDIHRAAHAYWQNNNAVLGVDGSLHSLPACPLTTDAVHPSTVGNTLIADLIANGIVSALRTARVAKP